MDFSALIAELRDVAEKYRGKDAEPSISTVVYVDMFTKILKQVQKSVDDYEDQIMVLWVTLNQLAAIYKELVAGAPRDHLCRFIFGMCARTVLNIQWPQLDEDSEIKRNFCMTVENVHKILSEQGLPRFQLILDLMESHWTHPILSEIMSAEEDVEGGLEYIQQEDPDILKLRIEIMMKENCEEFALNLCSWSLKNPTLANDLKIKEWQIVMLYKQNEYGKMQEVCESIVCHNGIKVMSHLAKTPSNQELCIRLAQIFLIQDWIQSDRNCCTQELLKLWIHHQYLADKDEERFLESIWAVAKVSSTTDQIGVLIDGVRKECGEMFIQLYTDLCKFALNIDKGNMVQEIEKRNFEEVKTRQMRIAKTCIRLAFLIKDSDFHIARVCGLTAFSLNPSTDSLNLVNKLYWTIKNASATSGRCKINPATLYEIERLLDLMRPTMLKPDLNWKQIIPLCKKYKSDREKVLEDAGGVYVPVVNVNLDVAVKVENIKLEDPVQRDTGPLASDKKQEKVESASVSDNIPSTCISSPHIQHKSSMSKAEVQPATVQAESQKSSSIETSLGSQFPSDAFKDLKDGPDLSSKDLTKTINDLKQSIYLETQYREQFSNQLTNFSTTKKEEPTSSVKAITKKKEEAMSVKANDSSYMKQVKSNSTQQVRCETQNKYGSPISNSATVQTTCNSDVTQKQPSLHSYQMQQSKLQPNNVGGSPPATQGLQPTNVLSGYSCNQELTSSTKPKGPPFIKHSTNLTYNSPVPATPVSVTDSAYNNIHNVLLEKQQSSTSTSSVTTQHNKHTQPNQTSDSTRQNLLQRTVRSSEFGTTSSSPQECAKIAQQIAEMHEKQRAERERNAQKSKPLLNSRNIPSSSQISNMLNLHLKNKNASPSPVIQKSSIVSEQMEQELRKPYHGDPLENMQAIKPKRKYTKKISYDKTGMSNTTGVRQGKKNKDPQPVSCAIQMATESLPEAEQSQTMKKQKYYLAAPSVVDVVDKLTTDSTGNLSLEDTKGLSVKPVFSMVVPKSLTSPKNQEALMKTVTNMVQKVGTNAQFSQSNVESYNKNTASLTTATSGSTIQQEIMAQSKHQEMISQPLPAHVVDFLKNTNKKADTQPRSSSTSSNPQTAAIRGSGSSGQIAAQMTTNNSKNSSSIGTDMKPVHNLTAQVGTNIVPDSYMQMSNVQSHLYSCNSYTHHSSGSSNYSSSNIQPSVTQSGVSDQMFNQIPAVFTQDNVPNFNAMGSMQSLTEFPILQQTVDTQMLNRQRNPICVTDRATLDHSQMINNQYLTLGQPILDQTIVSTPQMINSQQHIPISQQILVNQQQTSPAVTQVNIAMQATGITPLYQMQDSSCQRVVNVQNVKAAPSQQIVNINTPENINIVPQQHMVNNNAMNQMVMQSPMPIGNTQDQTSASSAHGQTRSIIGQTVAINTNVTKQKSAPKEEVSPSVLQHILSDLMKAGSIKQNPKTGELEITDSGASSQETVLSLGKERSKPSCEYENIKQSVLEATKTLLQKRQAKKLPTPELPNTGRSHSNRILAQTLTHTTSNSAQSNLPNESLLTSTNLSSSPSSNANLNQTFRQTSVPQKQRTSQIMDVPTSLPDLPDLGSKEFAIDSILNLDNQLDVGSSIVADSHSHAAARHSYSVPLVNYTASSESTCKNQSLPSAFTLLNRSKENVENTQIQKAENVSHQVLLTGEANFQNNPSRTSQNVGLTVPHSSFSGAQSTYFNANRLARDREDRESNLNNVEQSSRHYQKNDVKGTEETSSSRAMPGNATTTVNCAVSQEQCNCSSVSNQEYASLKQDNEAQQKNQMETSLTCHSKLALFENHTKTEGLTENSELKTLRGMTCSQYYFCTKCNFANKKADMVSKHVDLCSKTVQALRHVKAELGVVYQCEMCMAKFVEKESVDTHITKHCPKRNSVPIVKNTHNQKVKTSKQTLSPEPNSDVHISPDVPVNSSAHANNNRIVDHQKENTSVKSTEVKVAGKLEEKQENRKTAVVHKELSQTKVDIFAKQGGQDNIGESDTKTNKTKIDKTIEKVNTRKPLPVDESDQSDTTVKAKSLTSSVLLGNEKKSLDMDNSRTKQVKEITQPTGKFSAHYLETDSMVTVHNRNCDSRDQATGKEGKLKRKATTKEIVKCLSSADCDKTVYKKGKEPKKITSKKKSDIKMKETELSENKNAGVALSRGSDVCGRGDNYVQDKSVTAIKPNAFEKAPEEKIVGVKQIDKDNELYKLYDVHLAKQVRERIEKEKAKRNRQQTEADKIHKIKQDTESVSKEEVAEKKEFLSKEKSEHIHKKKETQLFDKEKAKRNRQQTEADKIHKIKQDTESVSKEKVAEKKEFLSKEKSEHIHKKKETQLFDKEKAKRNRQQMEADKIHKIKQDTESVSKEKVAEKKEFFSKEKSEHIHKKKETQLFDKEKAKRNRQQTEADKIHKIKQDTESVSKEEVAEKKEFLPKEKSEHIHKKKETQLFDKEKAKRNRQQTEADKIHKIKQDTESVSKEKVAEKKEFLSKEKSEHIHKKKETQLFDKEKAKRNRQQTEADKIHKIKQDTESVSKEKVAEKKEFLSKEKSEHIHKKKETQLFDKDKGKQIGKDNETVHIENEKEAKNNRIDNEAEYGDSSKRHQGKADTIMKVPLITSRKERSKGLKEVGIASQKVSALKKKKHKVSEVCNTEGEPKLKTIVSQRLNKRSSRRNAHSGLKRTTISPLKKPAINPSISSNDRPKRFLKQSRFMSISTQDKLHSKIHVRRSPQETRNRRLRSLRSVSSIKKRIFLIDEMEPIGSSQVHCKICGDKTFSRTLARHYSHVHHFGFVSESDCFRCEYCSFSCPSLSSIKRHVQRHADQIIKQVNKLNTQRSGNSNISKSERNVKQTPTTVEPITSSDESPRSAKLRKHLKALVSRSRCADRLKKISEQASNSIDSTTEESISLEFEMKLGPVNMVNDGRVTRSKDRKRLKCEQPLQEQDSSVKKKERLSSRSPTTFNVSEFSVVSNVKDDKTRSRSSSVSSRSSVNVSSVKRKSENYKDTMSTKVEVSNRSTKRSYRNKTMYSMNSRVSDTSSEQRHSLRRADSERAKQSNNQKINLSTDSDTSENEKMKKMRKKIVPSTHSIKHNRDISETASAGFVKQRTSSKRLLKTSSDDEIRSPTQSSEKQRKLSGASSAKDDGTFDDNVDDGNINPNLLSEMQQSPISKRTRYSTSNVHDHKDMYSELYASDSNTSENDAKDVQEQKLQKQYKHSLSQDTHSGESEHPLPRILDTTNDSTKILSGSLKKKKKNASNNTNKHGSQKSDKDNRVGNKNVDDNIESNNDAPETCRLLRHSIRKKSKEHIFESSLDTVGNQTLIDKKCDPAVQLPLDKNVKHTKHNLKSCAKSGVEKDKHVFSKKTTSLAVMLHPDDDDEFASLKALPVAPESSVSGVNTTEQRLDSTVLLGPDEEFCPLVHEKRSEQSKPAAALHLDMFKEVPMESTVLFNPADEFSGIQIPLDSRKGIVSELKPGTVENDSLMSKAKPSVTPEYLANSVLLSPHDEFSDLCSNTSDRCADSTTQEIKEKVLSTAEDCKYKTKLESEKGTASETNKEKYISEENDLFLSDAVKPLITDDCLGNSVLLNPDEEFSDLYSPNTVVKGAESSFDSNNVVVDVGFSHRMSTDEECNDDTVANVSSGKEVVSTICKQSSSSSKLHSKVQIEKHVGQKPSGKFDSEYYKFAETRMSKNYNKENNSSDSDSSPIPFDLEETDKFAKASGDSSYSMMMGRKINENEAVVSSDDNRKNVVIFPKSNQPHGFISEFESFFCQKKTQVVSPSRRKSKAFKNGSKISKPFGKNESQQDDTAKDILHSDISETPKCMPVSDLPECRVLLDKLQCTNYPVMFDTCTQETKEIFDVIVIDSDSDDDDTIICDHSTDSGEEISSTHSKNETDVIRSTIDGMINHVVDIANTNRPENNSCPELTLETVDVRLNETVSQIECKLQNGVDVPHSQHDAVSEKSEFFRNAHSDNQQKFNKQCPFEAVESTDCHANPLDAFQMDVEEVLHNVVDNVVSHLLVVSNGSKISEDLTEIEVKQINSNSKNMENGQCDEHCTVQQKDSDETDVLEEMEIARSMYPADCDSDDHVTIVCANSTGEEISRTDSKNDTEVLSTEFFRNTHSDNQQRFNKQCPLEAVASLDCHANPLDAFQMDVEEVLHNVVDNVVSSLLVVSNGSKISENLTEIEVKQINSNSKNMENGQCDEHCTVHQKDSDETDLLEEMEIARSKYPADCDSDDDVTILCDNSTGEEISSTNSKNETDVIRSTIEGMIGHVVDRTNTNRPENSRCPELMLETVDVRLNETVSQIDECKLQNGVDVPHSQHDAVSEKSEFFRNTHSDNQQRFNKQCPLEAVESLDCHARPLDAFQMDVEEVLHNVVDNVVSRLLVVSNGSNISENLTDYEVKQINSNSKNMENVQCEEHCTVQQKDSNETDVHEEIEIARSEDPADCKHRIYSVDFPATLGSPALEDESKSENASKAAEPLTNFESVGQYEQNYHENQLESSNMMQFCVRPPVDLSSSSDNPVTSVSPELEAARKDNFNETLMTPIAIDVAGHTENGVTENVNTLKYSSEQVFPVIVSNIITVANRTKSSQQEPVNYELCNQVVQDVSVTSSMEQSSVATVVVEVEQSSAKITSSCIETKMECEGDDECVTMNTGGDIADNIYVNCISCDSYSAMTPEAMGEGENDGISGLDKLVTKTVAVETCVDTYSDIVVNDTSVSVEKSLVNDKVIPQDEPNNASVQSVPAVSDDSSVCADINYELIVPPVQLPSATTSCIVSDVKPLVSTILTGQENIHTLVNTDLFPINMNEINTECSNYDEVEDVDPPEASDILLHSKSAHCFESCLNKTLLKCQTLVDGDKGKQKLNSSVTIKTFEIDNIGAEITQTHNEEVSKMQSSDITEVSEMAQINYEVSSESDSNNYDNVSETSAMKDANIILESQHSNVSEACEDLKTEICRMTNSSDEVTLCTQPNEITEMYQIHQGNVEAMIEVRKLNNVTETREKIYKNMELQSNSVINTSETWSGPNTDAEISKMPNENVLLEGHPYTLTGDCEVVTVNIASVEESQSCNVIETCEMSEINMDITETCDNAQSNVKTAFESKSSNVQNVNVESTIESQPCSVTEKSEVWGKYVPDVSDSQGSDTTETCAVTNDKAMLNTQPSNVIDTCEMTRENDLEVTSKSISSNIEICEIAQRVIEGISEPKPSTNTATCDITTDNQQQACNFTEMCEATNINVELVTKSQLHNVTKTSKMSCNIILMVPDSQVIATPDTCEISNDNVIMDSQSHNGIEKCEMTNVNVMEVISKSPSDIEICEITQRTVEGISKPNTDTKTCEITTDKEQQTCNFTETCESTNKSVELIIQSQLSNEEFEESGRPKTNDNMMSHSINTSDMNKMTNNVILASQQSTVIEMFEIPHGNDEVMLQSDSKNACATPDMLNSKMIIGCQPRNASLSCEMRGGNDEVISDSQSSCTTEETQRLDEVISETKFMQPYTDAVTERHSSNTTLTCRPMQSNIKAMSQPGQITFETQRRNDEKRLKSNPAEFNEMCENMEVNVEVMSDLKSNNVIDAFEFEKNVDIEESTYDGGNADSATVLDKMQVPQSSISQNQELLEHLDTSQTVEENFPFNIVDEIEYVVDSDLPKIHTTVSDGVQSQHATKCKAILDKHLDMKSESKNKNVSEILDTIAALHETVTSDSINEPDVVERQLFPSSDISGASAMPDQNSVESQLSEDLDSCSLLRTCTNLAGKMVSVDTPVLVQEECNENQTCAVMDKHAMLNSGINVNCEMTDIKETTAVDNFQDTEYIAIPLYRDEQNGKHDENNIVNLDNNMELSKITEVGPMTVQLHDSMVVSAVSEKESMEKYSEYIDVSIALPKLHSEAPLNISEPKDEYENMLRTEENKPECVPSDFSASNDSVTTEKQVEIYDAGVQDINEDSLDEILLISNSPLPTDIICPTFDKSTTSASSMDQQANIISFDDKSSFFKSLNSACETDEHHMQKNENLEIMCRSNLGTTVTQKSFTSTNVTEPCPLSLHDSAIKLSSDTTTHLSDSKDKHVKLCENSYSSPTKPVQKNITVAVTKKIGSMKSAKIIESTQLVLPKPRISTSRSDSKDKHVKLCEHSYSSPTKPVQKNITVAVTKKIGSRKSAKIIESTQHILPKPRISTSKNYCEEVKRLISKSKAKSRVQHVTSVIQGKTPVRKSASSETSNISKVNTILVQKVPLDMTSEIDKVLESANSEQKVSLKSDITMSQNSKTKTTSTNVTYATVITGRARSGIVKDSIKGVSCIHKSIKEGRVDSLNENQSQKLKTNVLSVGLLTETSESSHSDNIPGTRDNSSKHKVVHKEKIKTDKETKQSDANKSGIEPVVNDDFDFKRRTENVKKALKKSHVKPYQSDFDICDDDGESVISSVSSTNSTNSIESKHLRLLDFANETQVSDLIRNTSPLFMLAQTNASPEKVTVSRMATKLAPSSKYESPSMAQKIFSGDIVKKYSRRMSTKIVKPVLTAPVGTIRDCYLLPDQVPVSHVQYPDIKASRCVPDSLNLDESDNSVDSLTSLKSSTDHFSNQESLTEADRGRERGVKLHLLRESRNDEKAFSWDDPQAETNKRGKSKKQLSKSPRLTRSSSPQKINTEPKQETVVISNNKQKNEKSLGNRTSRVQSKRSRIVPGEMVDASPDTGSSKRNRSLSGEVLDTSHRLKKSKGNASKSTSLERKDTTTALLTSKRSRSASSENSNVSKAKLARIDTDETQSVLDSTSDTMNCCCSVDDLDNACEKCSKEAERFEQCEPRVRRVIHGGKVFEIKRGNIKETNIKEDLTESVSNVPVTSKVSTQSRVTRLSAAVKNPVDLEHKKITQQSQIASNSSKRSLDRPIREQHCIESQSRSASVQAVGNLNEYICATLNEIRKQRNSASGNKGSKWKMPRKPKISARFPYSFKKTT